MNKKEVEVEDVAVVRKDLVAEVEDVGVVEERKEEVSSF